ncbi:2211_t:CDS:2, partial [Dentiscutata heterogama]
DEDIVAAFKLVNPTIKLPSRRKLKNLANSDDKKFLFDIAEIINDSTFWTDLKELDEILLLFCTTLNKLQCESARLYDIIHAYAWIDKTVQKRPDSPFCSHMLLSV